MLNTITDFLGKIDNFVWGLPLIILILATGLFLTVRLRGLQIIRFPLAIRYMFSSDEEDGNGEVSSFAALCTALSATIGTGNIVGVATAIVSGGPGALFWMWMAAIVGTATKYAECLLAVKYRVVEKDGHIIGGPFYYIENGMGKQFRWLAKIFAVFGIMVGLFGIGTFTQINGITSAVGNFFDADSVHYINLFGRDYSITIGTGFDRRIKKNIKCGTGGSSFYGDCICFGGSYYTWIKHYKDTCRIDRDSGGSIRT